MIRKYKKKPVVIEALQFTRDTWDAIVDFTEGKATNLNKSLILEDKYLCTIETLEGNMTATEGDYIIKGVFGEFYPHKPDIFEQVYEEVFE